MADVQLEHGHVRIANRLYEALLDAEFSPTQFKIMHGLIRLSFGWGRKTVTLSHAELAHAVHMHPSGAFRGELRELVLNGCVILVDPGGGSNKATYAVQKDYTKWGGLSLTADRLKARFGARPESHDELLPADKKAGTVPESGHTPSLEEGTGTMAKSLSDETVHDPKDKQQNQTANQTSTTTASVVAAEDREREEAEGAAAHEMSIALARAANRGITARWGEQINVLHFSTGVELAMELVRLGANAATACAAIEDACKRSKKTEPPSTVSWFRAPIIAAVHQVEQRELNATDPNVKRGGAPKPIMALVASGAAQREREQRAEYDKARREAGVVWGKNPANATEYQRIVAAANAEHGDWLDTDWGKRARDIAIVIACAVASGFPEFDAWIAIAA
jgi:hypothetical protein